MKLLKVIWNVGKQSLLPAIATMLLLTVETLASEIDEGSYFSTSTPSVVVNQNLNHADSLTQMNSVSDLAEILPSDWETQSLQSLMQRYGVTETDSTFSGNRVMTRYEFAANLGATINHINQLVLAGNTKLVAQQDLEILKRLGTEFAQELEILQGRVKRLEANLPLLEVQQFSTTTKLEGEVLFAIAAVASGDKADNSGEPISDNLTFSNRVRLNLDTSFTGKDRLRTRLQARNVPELDEATGTDMARLAFQGDSSNNFEMSLLEYRFPIGEQAMVYLEAVGGDLDDVIVDTLNPYLSGSGSGSISRFAQRNPIYRQGEGAGVGIVYNFTEALSLSLGYIADEINEPELGLSKSSYGAIAQLTLQPSENTGVGLTYIRSYNNLDTGTGSRRANDPFNGQSDAIIGDSFGLETAIALNPSFTLTGWVGFTLATAEDLPNAPMANIVNWALTLAFIDVGTEGSIVGIAIGQPPKVTSNDFEVAGEAYKDEDTSWHLEAFWRYQVSDNIAITPGLLVITNPESDRDNNTIYIGTIRTTFSF
ncbi:iron uptake porin [Chlorogloeopsis sp. ULAP01]|uniref:iron uptake porin n=1 Tax=Chlorogloeopsis sp. ULAP01 TaxID=3056483 RepID=UPI0025AAA60F|nr:iron uptake porin [Chlorogloeopsis sp. ULAP01]MDM9383144.1 iron uptake porin [Chlorogloeopsis sp. ULAP01]